MYYFHTFSASRLSRSFQNIYSVYIFMLTEKKQVNLKENPDMDYFHTFSASSLSNRRLSRSFQNIYSVYIFMLTKKRE